MSGDRSVGEMTHRFRADFEAIDAEAPLERVVVPGSVLCLGVASVEPKSAGGRSIDGEASTWSIVRGFDDGRRVGIRLILRRGEEDAEHPEGGDEEREYAAAGSSIITPRSRMGERSGDGLETIVGGNDLADVVSTGAELNEGHGHGGLSLRSGWHQGVCHGVLILFGGCQGRTPQFVR